VKGLLRDSYCLSEVFVNKPGTRWSAEDCV